MILTLAREAPRVIPPGLETKDIYYLMSNTQEEDNNAKSSSPNAPPKIYVADSQRQPKYC